VENRKWMREAGGLGNGAQATVQAINPRKAGVEAIDGRRPPEAGGVSGGLTSRDIASEGWGTRRGRERGSKVLAVRGKKSLPVVRENAHQGGPQGESRQRCSQRRAGGRAQAWL